MESFQPIAFGVLALRVWSGSVHAEPLNLAAAVQLIDSGLFCTYNIQSLSFPTPFFLLFPSFLFSKTWSLVFQVGLKLCCSG